MSAIEIASGGRVAPTVRLRGQGKRIMSAQADSWRNAPS